MFVFIDCLFNKIFTHLHHVLNVKKKLNRVKSLNISIDFSISEYSFRFDTRTRFSKNYAENALNILNKAVYNIDKHNHVKNRLSCYGKYGVCEYYKTKHCS